jgi:transcription initiation factor TFIIIB Brf1 subunit/transcription initiation factor TFIIB
MTTGQPPQPLTHVTPEQCKHPRVQIVSRDEDSEYVECKECGDVFESSEFKDMAIEETKGLDDEIA